MIVRPMHMVVVALGAGTVMPTQEAHRRLSCQTRAQSDLKMVYITHPFGSSLDVLSMKPTLRRHKAHQQTQVPWFSRRGRSGLFPWERHEWFCAVTQIPASHRPCCLADYFAIELILFQIPHKTMDSRCQVRNNARHKTWRSSFA